jgi:hypothetical protein
MGVRSFVRRHRLSVAVTGFVAAAGLAFGLFWFAPWQLFLDKKVDEALPSVRTAAATKTEAQPGGRLTLAAGEFRSLEHESSGRALILRLSDGSRYLRFEDLNTSNGPDLRVLLSVHPLDDDWHVWDDQEFLDLGGLKGNIGDQNYLLPNDFALSKYRTAVVWCRRFHVGFAVVPLDPVPGST